MKRCIFLGLFGLASLILVGCTNTDAPPRPTPGPQVSDIDKAKFVLASEPADFKGVLDIRKSGKDGEKVAVIGRIGGSKEPFTKGRLSFTIVDASFVPCNEKGEEDSETPWDFC